MGAQGQTTIDFGAFPGKSDASVTVTGQTGILSGSLVEAWLFPVATSDHSADEHLVETIRVMAGNIVAGTGFTIYAVNTSQINEPIRGPRTASTSAIPTTAMTAGGLGSSGVGGSGGGNGTRIYGQWTVAWVWN